MRLWHLNRLKLRHRARVTSNVELSHFSDASWRSPLSLFPHRAPHCDSLFHFSHFTPPLTLRLLICVFFERVSLRELPRSR